jgi:hypothetical protein
MTVHELGKVDSREVFGDEGDAICHPPVCECEDCSLPPPPDVIYNSAEALQEALLAVTKEAGGYSDGEQAAYYSGHPDKCEGFASRGCQCGGCMAREYRSNYKGGK